MKPELQNAAIAEECRWKYKGSPGFADLNYKAWIAPDGQKHYECPNYTGDLNAMHEAEKVLHAMNDWRLVRNYFANISPNLNAEDSLDSDDWKLRHATAAQLARAFLETLGLWVEEEQEPCCQKCGEKLQTNRKHEGYLGYDILCGLCADDMRNRHE